MPQVTLPTTPNGRPLRLLRSLRSLSEALSLDVYMRFNTFVQVELRSFVQNLRGYAFRQAAINPSLMFKGVGAVDVWDQYRIDGVSRAPPPEERAEDPPLYEKAVAALVPASQISSHPPRVPTPLGKTSEENRASRQSTVSVIPETPIALPSYKKHKTGSPPPNPRPVRRSVVSVGSHGDQMPLSPLFSRLWQLLDWGWSYNPTVHEKLREQLLALGTAAYDGDENRFASLRSEYSFKLMSMAGESIEHGLVQPLRTRPDAQVENLDGEVTLLIRWMNSVYHTADIVMEKELLLLVQAARAVKATALADPASVDISVEHFQKKKAYCAALVCFWFGSGRNLRLYASE